MRGIFGMIAALMLWSGACAPSAQPDVFPSQNPWAYASRATSSTDTPKFLPLLLQSYEHPSYNHLVLQILSYLQGKLEEQNEAVTRALCQSLLPRT